MQSSIKQSWNKLQSTNDRQEGQQVRQSSPNEGECECRGPIDFDENMGQQEGCLDAYFEQEAQPRILQQGENQNMFSDDYRQPLPLPKYQQQNQSVNQAKIYQDNNQNVYKYYILISEGCEILNKKQATLIFNFLAQYFQKQNIQQLQQRQQYQSAECQYMFLETECLKVKKYINIKNLQEFILANNPKHPKNKKLTEERQKMLSFKNRKFLATIDRFDIIKRTHMNNGIKKKIECANLLKVFLKLRSRHPQLLKRLQHSA